MRDDAATIGDPVRMVSAGGRCRGRRAALGIAIRDTSQNDGPVDPPVAASGARITIDPTNGKIVVPSELNACAKVSRLDAVFGAPRRLMSGFATTWTMVTPAASTNNASRNTP